jgi:alkaline phosphatase D
MLLSGGVAKADPFQRIAMGSCSDQAAPQVIWDAIVETEPDLFVFLGDNIYSDTFDADVLRRNYETLEAIPGYARLKSGTPIEAIWDDHDYGLNDGGAEYTQKRASQALFLDFFDEPADSERRKTEGIYTVRYYGPPGQRVQLILLDTRYFRSRWTKSWKLGVRYRPNSNASLTMLGDTQWKWLAEQLEQPADIRLIASGIQVVNDEHGYETWGLFPRERERLFALLREKKVTGTILLSGDRHFAEVSEIDVGLGYGLLDLTSSGMTHSWEEASRTSNRHRLAIFGGLNFATIDIDWGEDPIISLNIHGVDGDVVERVTRRLSDLGG